MTTKNTELFTALTAEQSATVEGGANPPTLLIHSIKAIKSGENGRFSRTDDVEITINGKKLPFKKNNIIPGAAPTTVNQAADFRGSRAIVQVLDDDPRGSDKRARFTLLNTGINKVLRPVTRSGGDSRYRIVYSMLVRRQ